MDVITDTGTDPSDQDMVSMTDAVRTDPVIVKDNNNLYLFVDSNNYMQVNDQFASATDGIERLQVSDGYYINRQDIENIVNTMSSINNDPGLDLIQKYEAMRVNETYITTLAQSWHQV